MKAGKKLKIQVCNQSEENKYIQAIYWNGERYTKRFISHHTLIEGGNLIYEMGNKPAETCFDKYSLPYSLSSEDNHRIIPAVQEQQVYASNLNLSSGYHIVLQDNRLENERLWLKKYLQNDFQLIENSQGKTIRLILQSSSEQKEDEYQIDIQDEVKIISPSARGIFYGIQTLRQLMITTAGQCSLPQLAIKDRPYYPWRAYMLDESRVFQGKEAVKSILDEMARLKMNIFHWHLTDDQGWRIEIKKYPKLCQIGARRDSTQLNGWKGNSFDGKVHEGYYTQKEIKEIIEYAQSLHIQIIPEIEMPGHSSAVIAAYPEFGTTKKQIKVPCSFGVQYEVLDVSSQKVIQFLHDVLDEVIALFPSPIIHIGGDEVKYDQWNASVAISNYIKKLGVANPAELQIEFTNAISEWLIILPVFVADQRHELLARRRVREEYSGECRGSRGRTLLFDAPHLHTHMAGFDHDGDAHRVEGFLDAVADLHRQAFLHLQAAGEALHHAGDFRKARDVSVGDVRHVRFAVEGQHVVLAERV